MSLWIVVPFVLIAGVGIGIAFTVWIDSQSGPKF